MNEQLFSVKGEKISTLLLGEESLKLSSNDAASVEKFHESWSKKISLATKTEIKYDAITLVKQEVGDEDVSVKYKATIGREAKFAFASEADREAFYLFLESEKGFFRSNQELTPFKAISGQLIALVVVMAITGFAYYQALEIAAGTASEGGTRKSRLFNSIVETLGDKGVLLAGAAISAFIGYGIWKRYSNPPSELRLERA